MPYCVLEVVKNQDDTKGKTAEGAGIVVERKGGEIPSACGRRYLGALPGGLATLRRNAAHDLTVVRAVSVYVVR